MKNIAVLFGGVSPEHEVSIISGLQVLENIDRNLFSPYAIYLDKQGLFQYFKGFTQKKDFLKMKSEVVNFGHDKRGVFFETSGLLGSKTYLDSAYLAFHGGNGESGQVQGFLEILGLPYTSPNVETSAISMNKVLTKEVLKQNKINTVDFARVFSEDVIVDVDAQIVKVMKKVSLPVIVKPTHLGSSIGINIARTKIELKKYLLEASHIDSEVLIEKLIKDFQEYNVSVRRIENKIEVSEVEHPLSNDEILSFADKYQRGGKKLGGMASLNRELPAKISSKLRNDLQKLAKDVFKIIRAKGMIRIDFMVRGGNIYVTEVNPIPGSMSFYLWEATGICFKEQITNLINQSFVDREECVSKALQYKSDIVEKFINSKDH